MFKTCKCTAYVKSVLNKNNIKNISVQRRYLTKNHFKNKNLVISVGGDGTFLRTSHFIKDNTLILGVNSDYKLKEGFYLKANSRNFENILKKIIKNEFEILRLNRLKAKINGKELPIYALNEFFIGRKKSYDLARMYVKIGNKKEFQKNSGVIVGTASGSHAWIYSAGGKKMPLASNRFQYVVREPFHGRLLKEYKLKKRILNKNQKIIIIPEMYDSILVADSGSKEYPLKINSKVEISMGDKKLRVICF